MRLHLWSLETPATRLHFDLTPPFFSTMSEYFETPRIAFEGAQSKNPFAFKHYDAGALVDGKTMAEHLRFGAAYWHCMRNELADPFGAGTALMPWDNRSDSIDNALKRVDVFFEFLDKIGIDYYCFHDRDIAPELGDLAKSNAALDKVVAKLKEKQDETGKKLLWGTACLFSHPRYAQGGGTSPDADVFAYGAAQIKAAMDATHALGGEGYTFWGGREGYASALWNTDMKTRVRSPRPHSSTWPWTTRRQIKLQGAVLHRAQAARTLHAPVRQRFGRLPQLSARIRPARPL